MSKQFLGLASAGLLLAACSQSAQPGRLSAARAVPPPASITLHDVVLHPGFRVQGLEGVSPAVMRAINADFQQDLHGYGTGKSRGKNSGDTTMTTVGALKAQGQFLGSIYTAGTQVVEKSAHGAFQNVYQDAAATHPPYKELTAIYDPQTGNVLAVGLIP